MIDALSLDPYEEVKCRDLSGGTKRKVCTAVALLGNPDVVFMDEPTSGMDAVTKRRVWRLIRRAAADSAVILTSHSMEECERLCSRLAIMASGRFLCLGSPGHIKDKYGRGLTLQLTLAANFDRGEIAAFVKSRFPKAEGVKLYRNTLTCRVNEAPYSVIYGHLMNAPDHLGLVDFAVNKTTLDDVSLYRCTYGHSPPLRGLFYFSPILYNGSQVIATGET